MNQPTHLSYRLAGCFSPPANSAVHGGSNLASQRPMIDQECAL